MTVLHTSIYYTDVLRYVKYAYVLNGLGQCQRVFAHHMVCFFD